jgi:SAM-dependent methyltransferase
MAPHGSQRHHHGHVRVDEADWEEFAAQTELEGELFLAFVTDSARWIADLRGNDGPPVRRVLDVGSGPGVGTCELARLFPDAHVVAIDGSPAMLNRTAQRAATLGLDRRITTHLAELPDGLDGLDPADVIWASMSLHHIGDETNALHLLGELLEPSGLLAVAEVAEAMRVLPDDLDIGRPGLADRFDGAKSSWFADMRAGLPGCVASTDLPSMLASAGLQVVGSRIATQRFDPPLSDTARQVSVGHIRRARQQLNGLLEEDDLCVLDVLTDPVDPRSVVHRSDAVVASSRQIVLARPRQHP